MRDRVRVGAAAVAGPQVLSFLSSLLYSFLSGYLNTPLGKHFFPAVELGWGAVGCVTPS